MSGAERTCSHGTFAGPASRAGLRLGLRQRAWQRIEPPEMGKPLRLAQGIKPHSRGPALVAVAQYGFWEIGWFDTIIERIAERFVAAGGFEIRHGASTLSQPIAFDSAERCLSPSWLALRGKSPYIGS